MPSTLIRHGDEGQFEAVEPGVSVRSIDIGENAGECTLQVVRLHGEDAEVEYLHRHEEGFSLAYVLNGWFDVHFQDLGVQHLPVGTVIPAFNGPTHRELAAGDDLELLLLVSPHSQNGTDQESIVLQREGDVDYVASPGGDLSCRDFGLTELTGGRIRAQSMRAVRGSQPDGQWHMNEDDFSVVYVAEGWMDVEYKDVGKARLEKGSVAVQRPGVAHMVTGRSDDLMLIEIAAPADN